MSDTRFTLIGVGLIFAGFLVLGAFGSQFNTATIESQEFGDCYEYFEDKPPAKIDCEFELVDKTIFFSVVIALIAIGVLSLIKGIKGKWDQQVNPKDMVGPGNTNDEESKDKSED